MARVALCDVRGLLIDAIEKLSGEEGTDWAERLKLALRKNDLLRRVTEVTVGVVKKFIVAENFRVGNAGIVWLSDNFKANFLDKVETHITATTLVVNRLEKASLDAGIRAELGSDREETASAHLFELLKKQSKGGAGVLLTNGYANIFYVRDANGKLWAVDADWDSRDRGWVVIAGSVADPDRWLGGDQVISRK